MKKKNLFVFDIDGTLSDTVEIHQKAFRESLKLIGVSDFNGTFGHYRHHTDLHIVRHLFESVNNSCLKTSRLEEFEDHLFEKVSRNRIKEIRGAVRMINNIQNNSDFGVCFATGSFLKPAALKLQRIGIGFCPEQLVTSNEIEEREKIVTKAIENAALYYGVNQFERIISFGDGIWDLKTAQNLEIEFIGVGTVNKKLLAENGMCRHYNDFENFDVAKI